MPGLNLNREKTSSNEITLIKMYIQNSMKFLTKYMLRRTCQYFSISSQLRAYKFYRLPATYRRQTFLGTFPKSLLADSNSISIISLSVPRGDESSLLTMSSPHGFRSKPTLELPLLLALARRPPPNHPP
jgi:hypothetical protein